MEPDEHYLRQGAIGMLRVLDRLQAAEADRERLRARVAELERDAERYRLLIESSLSGEISFMGHEYHGKAALDAAIDAYAQEG